MPCLIENGLIKDRDEACLVSTKDNGVIRNRDKACLVSTKDNFVTEKQFLFLLLYEIMYGLITRHSK